MTITAPQSTGSHAPRTAEELTAAGTSAHGLGRGQRPARGHGHEARGLQYLPLSALHEGRFGRLFRLPPYVPSDTEIARVAALMTEGSTGGDRTLDNPTIPAGYTYLGQFIDHDLTFDPASSLERQNDPDALTSFRSPRFDLDSVYGRGPADDPFLYDRASQVDGAAKLLIGSNGRDDDLPRNSQGVALLGDPRNDENTFVGQLHLTMLKFHNAVMDRVLGDPHLTRGSETPFETAQRIVRWHYQWVVVHDFLRRTIGDAALAELLVTSPDGRPEPQLRHFTWHRAPYIPVEFSVAAYRFGHSQVRGRYRLNTVVGAPDPADPQARPGLPTFTPDPVDKEPLGHFGGFRPLPQFWTIEWARFFELDGAGSDGLQHSRKIDTHLANPLATLPPEIGGAMPSLIARNLTRGARLLLPSGQAMAARTGVERLTEQEIGLDGAPAPLWYYVLREAEVQADGEHLGQLGGRVVGEVFLGLLQADQSSYLRNEPTWRPFLGAGDDVPRPDPLRVAGPGLGPTPG
ncbi:peroxidase family protein [Cellulomonas wangsupingiae]|uniref:peroxidase family protein n=1 Tax=Cellulomonas wangsupingiae TaxID=2968085 RepID=UPI00202DB7D4|nr:heme peroxidase family protein [Cellulomonas wangsupingiae]MCM0638063.1 heme peroxidase family protein [Cellulomonas wangsupingiae]